MLFIRSVNIATHEEGRKFEMDERGAEWWRGATRAHARPKLHEERGGLARSQYRGDPRDRSIVYLGAVTRQKGDLRRRVDEPVEAAYSCVKRENLSPGSSVTKFVRVSTRASSSSSSSRRFLARKAVGNLARIRRTQSVRRRQLLSRPELAVFHLLPRHLLSRAPRLVTRSAMSLCDTYVWKVFFLEYFCIFGLESEKKTADGRWARDLIEGVTDRRQGKRVCIFRSTWRQFLDFTPILFRCVYLYKDARE